MVKRYSLAFAIESWKSGKLWVLCFARGYAWPRRGAAVHLLSEVPPEPKATNDIAEEKFVQHACLALFPVTEFRSDLQKWRKKATSHLNVPIPFPDVPTSLCTT